jgi:DNA-binding transcriptional LysR family regulator
MHYTLHQLQIFTKLSELKSVTRTAEALHLSQPAVSIQLKNFQNQFEIPLFEVVNRKVFITEFGNEIAASATEIIDRVERINHRTQAYKGQLIGDLKIAVVSTAKYVMPFFLTEFLQQHRNVNLSMDVTNKRRVVESLKANEVDFALVSIPPADMKIEKLDLLPNVLYLVGNASAPERSKPFGKEIFAQAPLIYREEGSGTRLTMERYLNPMKITNVRRLELTSNEAVKQAVIAGLGFSIMPVIGLRNELINSDLKIIPVKGLPIATTWSIIWLNGKNHSPVAKACIDAMRDNGPSIVEKHFKWYQNFTLRSTVNLRKQ